jgi:hypothetical protein
MTLGVAGQPDGRGVRRRCNLPTDLPKVGVVIFFCEIIIDPAIKYLNKDSAMPNRMQRFRESKKWSAQYIVIDRTRR